MKYWNELIAIEEQSIRLECLTSLVNVIANGIDNSNKKEVENSIWHITGALEDINTKLKEAFSNCFDAVRDAEFLHQIEEPGCGGNCDSCLCDTPEESTYEFEELQTAINSWHQKQ
jgi:hypothetical protein